jgi:mRNA-degrading endonuclease RelE of RelBE toxin-antitoxin system
MAYVTLEAEAADQFNSLPERIKSRVTGIIERLGYWPEVSGAKPLRANLTGRYRIRTGDYRLQFHVRGDEVIIERIGHRDRFYDE